MFTGLTNVIGSSVHRNGITFVPIVGNFSFADQLYNLEDHIDSSVLEPYFDEEPFGYESLWIRARLIAIFGINHPTGHCLQTLLDFQFASIVVDAVSGNWAFYPVLLCDTRDGAIGEYGYVGEPGLMFPDGMVAKVRDRIIAAFAKLLLAKPGDLGVFHDYLACEYDGSVESVSCDGYCILREYLGYLYPPNHNASYDDVLEGWWPFTLPRAKRRLVGAGRFPFR